MKMAPVCQTTSRGPRTHSLDIITIPSLNEERDLAYISSTVFPRAGYPGLSKTIGRQQLHPLSLTITLNLNKELGLAYI
jgi:hypothetical protein